MVFFDEVNERRVFHDRTSATIEIARAGVKPALVMLVDLDRFKAVNDTMGHPIRDALLRWVAKRFGTVLRQQDIVARLGGDEFGMLIVPAPDAEEAAKLAKRIIHGIGRRYLIDGHVVNIGARIGIALAGRDGQDQEQLLRAADRAMYDAKSNSRNRFSFFRPAMDDRAMSRLMMEIDLRKALALRQFELHYQPQIELDGNVLVGFEALLRWRHPERGLVLPLDFIPLAEEIGLIVPLGDWVLREACQQASRWPDEVSVAVNVSPRQFEDGSKLVASVAKALSASHLAARRNVSQKLASEEDQMIKLYGVLYCCRNCLSTDPGTVAEEIKPSSPNRERTTSATESRGAFCSAGAPSPRSWKDPLRQSRPPSSAFNVMSGTRRSQCYSRGRSRCAISRAGPWRSQGPIMPLTRWRPAQWPAPSRASPQPLMQSWQRSGASSFAKTSGSCPAWPEKNAILDRPLNVGILE